MSVQNEIEVGKVVEDEKSKLNILRAEYLSKLQENKFAIKLTNGFPLIIMNETDKINYIEYVIRYKGDDISLLLTFAAHFFTLGSKY